MPDGKNSQHRYAGYIVNATVLEVLMEYAHGDRKHEGWCFTVDDEEHLERQLPCDEVSTCPVCEAAFEVQQQMRSADASYERHMEEVQGRFTRGSKG